ncbi:amidohydrolase family protein [Streptomyces sp. NPDC048415]|uniref:amidohydrolase family protein n=1 Tax=Streptomyces sp. NPDC048415 TaxID=3154822 RepID=UPI0034245385
MTFHLRGTVLPDGAVRDLWLLGDRITFDRPTGAADTVTIADGGFLLPGLVDAHTHPGADDKSGRPEFVPELFAEQIAAHRESGTTALRFPGLAGEVPSALRDAPDSPRMITAGRWLAWAGLSKSAVFHTVTDDLVAAAVTEAKAHDGWCKLMGDWDFEAAPVPYELLRAVVDGVHATGGRVAVHCQSAEGVLSAARAGVDSIEHGMGMPEQCVALMAAHGTAYVPTLTAFAHSAPRRIEDNARDRLWRAGHRTMIRRVREAYDAGVTVLAGTDSAPFGNVATEVEHLIAAGLPAEAAVGAASWTARAFLGLSGLTEGGLADVTVYDADPRLEPGTLRHPRRIVLRGRVVR